MILYNKKILLYKIIKIFIQIEINYKNLHTTLDKVLPIFKYF